MNFNFGFSQSTIRGAFQSAKSSGLHIRKVMNGKMFQTIYGKKGNLASYSNFRKWIIRNFCSIWFNPRFSGIFGWKVCFFFGNLPIVGRSGTFPRKFYHQLLPRRKLRNLWLNGKFPSFCNEARYTFLLIHSVSWDRSDARAAKRGIYKKWVSKYYNTAICTIFTPVTRYF